MLVSCLALKLLKVPLQLRYWEQRCHRLLGKYNQIHKKIHKIWKKSLD